jgi:hypothetical protein
MMVVMVVMVVMGAQEVRGMVMMVVMAMGPVFFFQVWSAAGRRPSQSPPQVFAWACPVTESRTLNLLSWSLVLEAERPCL